MSRRAKGWAGHLCPSGGDEHGPLLQPKDGGQWHCPHQSHDGRPKTHRLGEAPPTPAFFTTAQAEGAA